MANRYPERVFLCHASENQGRVQETYRCLQKSGLSPWIDKKDIPVAAQWDSEIRETLQAARFVVIFLSAQLLAKSEGYVQKEIELALGMSNERSRGELLVFTARLDESDIPAAFTHLPSVDLSEADGDERLVELVKEKLNIFTDPRGGQMYRTIHVGDQVWFAENLRCDAEGSSCYQNDRRREEADGRLYTWEAAQEACPSGWRIPTDEEWERLASAFGGYRDMDESGRKIGSPSQAFESLIIGGRSGFDASLGGLLDSAGRFAHFGRGGFYWTSTPREYTTDYGTFEDISRRRVDYETYKRLSSFTVETACIYYFYTLGGLPELCRANQFPLKPDPRPRNCGLSVRCLRDFAVST